MTVAERLRALASALPSDDSAVTFTRADLLALVEGTEEASSLLSRDLTVEDVAEEVGRAPSTVRGWLIDGKLQGYKLNGRDWRVTRSDLRDYLDDQRHGDEGATGHEDAEDVDITEWRKYGRETV